METKTIPEVLAFFAKELGVPDDLPNVSLAFASGERSVTRRVSRIHGGIATIFPGSSIRLQVRRAFGVEGDLNIEFERLQPEQPPALWRVRVTVNFPAMNKGVVEATAFLALAQEMVLLAAVLQAQGNEFIVPG